MHDEANARQRDEKRRQANQRDDRNGSLHWAILFLAVAAGLAAGTLRVVRAAGAGLALVARAGLLLRAVAGIATNARLAVRASARALSIARAASREGHRRQCHDAHHCHQFAFHLFVPFVLLRLKTPCLKAARIVSVP